MRRTLMAAITALFVVFSFSPSTNAQKPRKAVTRKSAAKVVRKPAALPSGAVRTPSGLTYLILQKGTGRVPKVGETVAYHYMGTFTNGVKFDSSYDHPEPFEFTFGVGEVIKGMDEGIAKLRVGDRALFVLPPELAYGSRGAGTDIPPNATLLFTVEMLDVKGLSLSYELFQIGKKSGASAIIARYRELKKGGFSGYYVNEAALNLLGYRLLRGKRVDDAIDVFKLIVEEYPGSANPHDSLGEAYLIAGKKELAIESYEKALAVDPKFPSAIKALEKLRANP